MKKNPCIFLAKRVAEEAKGPNSKPRWTKVKDEEGMGNLDGEHVCEVEKSMMDLDEVTWPCWAVLSRMRRSI